MKTVSGGLGQVGDLELNYPIGIGVILFGVDGWVVKNNNIFGNFKWGAAAFSDPLNARRRRRRRKNNKFTGNKWAAAARI